MTRDVTSLIIEAQDARARMQEAKKRIKSEVRRKYEQAIARDVAEAVADAEIEFARTLARVHASGVSQALLRREVLRTNVWGEWVRWRDLADIAPERVTVANAKEARRLENARWIWDLDAGTFTVQKNTKGETIDPPLVYPISTIRERRNGRVLGDTGDDNYEMDVWRSDPGLSREVEKEMRRAKEAGEIDENR